MNEEVKAAAEARLLTDFCTHCQRSVTVHIRRGCDCVSFICDYCGQTTDTVWTDEGATHVE